MKFTKIIGTTLAALYICTALSVGIFAENDGAADTAGPDTVAVAVSEKDGKEETVRELKDGLKEGLKDGLKDGARSGYRNGLKNGLKDGLKNGERKGN